MNTSIPTDIRPAKRGRGRPGPRDPNVKGHARGHAAYVMRTLRKIYGDGYTGLKQAILEHTEACLVKHPMQDATRRQVALHKAGHFIAFEAEGMVAARATIHGTASKPDGWGGTANCWNRRLEGLGPHSPDDLLSEARATLAGPLAEAALGDGDICSSIGEILELHFLVAHAAKMLGRDRHQVLDETLAGTAAIVDDYAEEIVEVVNLLMRRRCIWEEDCPEVLARVQKTPIDARSARLRRTAKPRFEELAQLVKTAPYRSSRALVRPVDMAMTAPHPDNRGI